MTASQQAIAALYGRLYNQAFVAGFQDASLVLGLALIVTMFIIPFFKLPPLSGQAPAAPAE